MCAIAGILSFEPRDRTEEVAKMLDKMEHRGPNDRKIINRGRLTLGHNLLAIIGHTPQPVENQEWIVAFNGYISNYKELDPEATSEADCILRGLTVGDIRFFDKLNGMFAIVAYHEEHGLFLIRDRYGIKPLYYTWKGDDKIFSSEIKPLLEYTPAEVHEESLLHYFTHQTTPIFYTLFKGIYEVDKIWYRSENHKLENPPTIEEAAEEVQMLIRKSIQRNLAASVPVGAYLSGGIDSSTIAYYAAVPTFTVKFDVSDCEGREAEFDEYEKAKEYADKLGVRNHSVILYSNDCEPILETLVETLEDLKQGMSYANYYAAMLASKHVKTVLEGTGADELFGGYVWKYPKPRIEGIVKGKRLYPGLQEALDNDMDVFLDGLLHVGDRYSMAHSIEQRLPFLDNDLVDFVLSLPVEYRYGKALLKINSPLPSAILNRKKQGFSSPDENWFKYWVLDYYKGYSKEYIDYNWAYDIIREHQAGLANNRLLIWSILCFDRWTRLFLNK